MKKMKLFSLAWPIFIETLLFMFLGFVDVFVLSQYDDLAASAVNTANQAVSITTIVFTVISTASAVLISQYLGAKKRMEASRIAALSLAFHLVFGVIISAVFLLFCRQIMTFIGAEGKLLELSADYLFIVGGFIFMQALLSAMSVIIRNHGLTKVPMFVTFGMNVMNTVLDVVLVLGLFSFPKLGVRGVAIATTLSRVMGVIVLAVVLFTKIEKPSVFRLLKPFPKEDVKNVIKIGVPAALEVFLYHISQLVITSIVLNCLTETELITKTYVQNVSSVFYVVAVAIGQASQILTGHLIGAKEYEKANRQTYKSYGMAIGITACVCVLGAFLRTNILDIFTDDSQVIALGANIILINIFLEFGRATNLVVIACLRGAGDVVYPTACAIFSMILVSTLGSYILAVVFDMGIYGLWIANAADECLRGVLMLIRWKSGKWRTKRIA